MIKDVLPDFRTMQIWKNFLRICSAKVEHVAITTIDVIFWVRKQVQKSWTKSPRKRLSCTSVKARERLVVRGKSPRKLGLVRDVILIVAFFRNLIFIVFYDHHNLSSIESITSSRRNKPTVYILKARTTLCLNFHWKSHLKRNFPSKDEWSISSWSS